MGIPQGTAVLAASLVVALVGSALAQEVIDSKPVDEKASHDVLIRDSFCVYQDKVYTEGAYICSTPQLRLFCESKLDDKGGSKITWTAQDDLRCK